MSEWFNIVDANDEIIGKAPRSECHGNPELIHRTAHVVVFSSDGRLLLQKRTLNKDVQPGKWDTAVGGHLDLGEDYEAGARREMNEELGIPADLPIQWLFHHRIRNNIESENIGVYRLVHDGPFQPQASEIDELRFWSWAEIRAALGKQLFTPNLESEIARLQELGLLKNHA